MLDIAEMNQAERDWIASLTAPLAGVAADPQQLSDHFEAQRAAWFALPDAERPDPHPLINATGAALGDLLAAGLGLRWVVATDEYGTEAAVYREANEVLLYPMNLVAKRWTPEPCSLAQVIAGVYEALASMS